MSRFSLVLTLGLISLSLTSCKVGRFIIYNFADIKDYKKFPDRPLQRSEHPFYFPKSQQERIPKTIAITGKQYDLEQYLQENRTVAFLVIQNDTILYEQYWADYDAAAIVPSFSMAKSLTSILIGCAIDDGLIQSIEEPVTNYIPELEKNGFDKVSIKHLLQMTSGLKFDEGYANPFGQVASFYYGTNLRKEIVKLKLEKEPGTHYAYKSGNTQLLGIVLERALKNKTVTSYLQEKIWQPLQMEFDASWSIDRKKNGLEKTFCCLNARARDYAKIGRLYLNKGNWNGNQVVAADWVKQSTMVNTEEGSVWYYQYQWWLPTSNGDFMAQGILGQFIYVNPAKNLIIVRLGKTKGTADWKQFFPSLANEY
jgi:CubicO group peptidase (beta-lactamase class C family)